MRSNSIAHAIEAPSQPLIASEGEAGGVLRLSLDDSDADGVGDEPAVGRVLAPVPVRFHPIVPLRDPLEKVLLGKGALAVTEQSIEELVIAHRQAHHDLSAWSEAAVPKVLDRLEQLGRLSRILIPSDVLQCRDTED